MCLVFNTEGKDNIQKHRNTKRIKSYATVAQFTVNCFNTYYLPSDHHKGDRIGVHKWKVLQILMFDIDIDILMYLLTAIGLTAGDSSTVHIYTQTIHRTTQLTTLVGRLSWIRTQSGQTKINDEPTA